MKKSKLPKKLSDIVRSKDDYIDTMLKKQDEEIARLQKELLNLILSDYLPQFQTDAEGLIINNAKNMGLINKVNKVFSDFSSEYADNYLKKYASRLLKTTNYSKEYFDTLTGNKTTVTKEIAKNTEIISQRIGITKKGEIIEGSFLDSLSQSAEVRNDIRNIVSNAVNNGYSMKYFAGEMKSLLTEDDEGYGRLQQYYKQYTYDTYSQVAQSSENYLADQLDLEFFIYEGSLIETSRPFCVSVKNGEKPFGRGDGIPVYSREEAEKWNGKEWAGKAGDFFVDRGGYQCRHWLNWITVEYAAELGHPEAVRIMAEANQK